MTAEPRPTGLRAACCPKCGPVLAARRGPHCVSCSCGLLIATCAGCGGLSLAGRAPLLRCVPCGYRREMRPEELAEALTLRMAEPARLPPMVLQTRTAPILSVPFEPPPMPTFRRGAQLPAPPPPRGYSPPKEKSR